METGSSTPLNTREKWQMHTKVWLENMKGRDHLEDFSIEERITLKCNLRRDRV
jgi:hypothetical protein